MKKYTLLYMLCAALFSACNPEEDFSVDPTLMPPVTVKGANTFGCLIDGWVYTSGRYTKPQAVYQPGQTETDPAILKIKAKVDEDSYVCFDILNPQEKSISIYSASETTENVRNLYRHAALVVNGDSTHLGTGKVNILRFQPSEGIVSGTFEGEKIAEGRFDIQYKK